MKYLLFAIFTLFNSPFILAQQTEKVIDWLNTNAISVENINSETELSLENNKLPSIFSNVRVFAFGEASHQHKEFFNAKIKFFKYLVENYGVRIFILEESFGASNEINDYLQGKQADIKSLVGNFRQSIWKTNEFLGLLEWIKSYNENVKDNNTIKFYGMDSMFNYNIVKQLNLILQENKYTLEASSKKFLESYEQERLLPDNDKSKLDQNLSLLENIKKGIQADNSFKSDKELSLHLLDVLKQYILFIANPNQKDRDKAMADNVEWILQSEGQLSKAFICAHNDHVKKTVLSKTSFPSMGNILSKKFSNTFYSIGIEFGIGEIKGLTEDGKWEMGKLEEPLKNSLAEVLVNAKNENFFFDINTASQNAEMKKFVTKNYDYIMVGGYGLRLKNIKYSIERGNLLEMYDGLLFIKKMTLIKSLN